MQTSKRWATHLATLAFHGVMAVGVGLMISASTSYLELGDAHPFFLEKLPLAHPRLWLTALYVHVPSALLALPACLLLVVRSIRARFPALHRWLGRITGALVLFGVVPSGMYLACFAQGGAVSTVGFWLTGLITFGAMVMSIAAARARDLRAHRRASAHVLAQLSVAVSSRLILASAEALGAHDEWIYVAALWLPVLGGVLVAELMFRPRGSWTSKGSRHEELVAVPRLDVVREPGASRAA